MSVDQQNAVIEFVVFATLMLVTIAVTAILCRRQLARHKSLSYATILIGAAIVPLALAILESLLEPDVWWSRAHKSSPQDFLAGLGFLWALCTLPALGVVLRYKRHSKKHEMPKV
jgi:cytochrome c biogenesis protein CcdA